MSARISFTVVSAAAGSSDPQRLIDGAHGVDERDECARDRAPSVPRVVTRAFRNVARVRLRRARARDAARIAPLSVRRARGAHGDVDRVGHVPSTSMPHSAAAAAKCETTIAPASRRMRPPGAGRGAAPIGAERLPLLGVMNVRAGSDPGPGSVRDEPPRLRSSIGSSCSPSAIRRSDCWERTRHGVDHSGPRSSASVGRVQPVDTGRSVRARAGRAAGRLFEGARRASRSSPASAPIDRRSGCREVPRLSCRVGGRSQRMSDSGAAVVPVERVSARMPTRHAARRVAASGHAVDWRNDGRPSQLQTFAPPTRLPHQRG